MDANYIYENIYKSFKFLKTHTFGTKDWIGLIYNRVLFDLKV